MGVAGSEPREAAQVPFCSGTVESQNQVKEDRIGTLLSAALGQVVF